MKGKSELTQPMKMQDLRVGRVSEGKRVESF